MHSLSGRSCVFDARADGFARSEASVSLTLLPLEARLTLQGSATRQDGKSASLSAPNGQAQRRLLQATLNDAGSRVLDVVEAAANGSPLGDPIEVGSVNAVLPSSMLLVANAKGSVAHSEPSSGISGLTLLGAKLLHAHCSARVCK